MAVAVGYAAAAASSNIASSGGSGAGKGGSPGSPWAVRVGELIVAATLWISPADQPKAIREQRFISGCVQGKLINSARPGEG